MADSREYFNAKATEWNVLPEHLRRSEMVAEYIRDKICLDPVHTDALDFGCGTGQLSFLLRKNVRSITAVDAAEGMIDQLRQKIEKTGTRNIQTQILDIEHEARLLPRTSFDLIFCQMVLHHIEGHIALLRELKKLLRPEGVLCLVDLDSENGSFHAGDLFIPHHGFDRAVLGTELQRLGYFNINFYSPYTIQKKDTTGKDRAYPLFMALAYNAPQ